MGRRTLAWISRKSGVAGTSARATLVLLLGIVVMFAVTAATAQAQRRGFAGGGHSAVHPMVSRGGFSRGAVRGGSFHQGPGAYRGFRGGRAAFGYRRYGPSSAFLQPYYYLPFGFAYDLGDNEPYFDDSGSGLESYGPYDGAPDEPEYPPEPDPDAAAMQMNQAALANQLQQLHAEVEDLRSAGTTTPPYMQPQSQDSEQAQPAVTLILRNGQELQVRDYAVMNQTFWDFSNRAVQKIPLSKIDIAASERATQANGGEFPAISSGQ